MENRKAYFEYQVMDKYIAGIVLIGPEVKAVKAGKCSFGDAYCVVNESSVILRHFHVSFDSEEPMRDRKLLLNKKEVQKLNRDIKEKGLTVVPLNMFTTKTGLVKFTIALCKGKKNYDKRASIKEKELKREIKNF